MNAQIVKPDSYLEVIGKAEYMMEPLNNANIELFKNGSLDKSLSTPRNGEFKFLLELNNEYVIKVSKKGFVSKKIMFNTDVPDGTEGKWINEFAIGLLDPCEGVDYHLLEKPVDKIYYHERKNQFVSNRSYTMEISGKMEMLVYDIEQCLYKKYDELIDKADRLFNAGKYREARQQYMLATQADPYDRYPQKKIEEIDALLMANQEKEEKYNATVDLADNHYKQGNIETAAGLYEKALELNPTDDYVTNRLQEVNSKLSAMNQQSKAKVEKDRKYNSLISQAEAAFYSNNYKVAKEFYTEAAGLKPNESLPGQRLAVINNNLNKEKENQREEENMQRLYSSSIETADRLFQLGEYKQARQSYQQAVNTKPSENYPKTKLNEIERLLAAQKKLEEEQNRKEQAFTNAVEQGERLLAQNQLAAAKSSFNRALQIKPQDADLRRKIIEIDKKISEKKLAEQQSAQKERDYETALQNADRLFRAGQYESALQQFRRASNHKPGDEYVGQKIKEINNLLEQQRQEKAQAEEINRRYKETIKTADQLLSLKEYNRAMESYRRAAIYKPDEEYPKSKINEIETILAQLEQQQSQEQANRMRYNQLLANGDNAMKNKNYSVAKMNFEKALELFPDESYPKMQLAKAEQLMLEKRNREAERLALKNQYEEALQQADAYMNNNDLQNAQIYYLQANKLMPNETYPKEKLDQISNGLAQLEKEQMEQQRNQEHYNAAIQKADGYYQAKNYAAAKSEYQTALRFLPDKDYPKKRINQINDILTLLAKNNATGSKQASSGRTSGSSDNDIKKLQFKNTSEKDKYIRSLRNKYPKGITKEVYKGEFKTMNRYIIIRNNEVNEFREIIYNWGSELYHFDIPVTSLYFRQQTSERDGEPFKEIVK
ncbi:MAG: tetratricopeptide repeat protein [Bacteroidetes bacterium]|nr:tetratricopeptide repeat protein [Bacteroidota bacterium]